MSGLGPHIDFSEAWTGFVDAVRTLWTGERAGNNRPELSHFTALADEAVALVRDVGLGAVLQEHYLGKMGDPRSAGPMKLYVLELTSFAAAAKGVPANQKHLLGNVSTVAKSANDIFSDLPWWAKAAIHGFGEVADLIRPK